MFEEQQGSQCAWSVVKEMKRNQKRVDDGLHQSGSKGNNEKWSDSGYYEVEETGCLNGLGVRCEINREVKDNSSSLNNWKNGVSLSTERRVIWMELGKHLWEGENQEFNFGLVDFRI